MALIPLASTQSRKYARRRSTTSPHITVLQSLVCMDVVQTLHFNFLEPCCSISHVYTLLRTTIGHELKNQGFKINITTAAKYLYEISMKNILQYFAFGGRQYLTLTSQDKLSQHLGTPTPCNIEKEDWKIQVARMQTGPVIWLTGCPLMEPVAYTSAITLSLLLCTGVTVRVLLPEPRIRSSIAKTKHIKMDVHFVKNNVLKGDIMMQEAYKGPENGENLELKKNKHESEMWGYNLQEFDLWVNHFYGDIPSKIENLSKLVHLDLSDNNLQGEIPNEIGNLKILEFLAIDTNYLSGPIPPGFQYFNRKNHESTRQSDFGPHASKHREFFNMRKSACRNNSQLHY
ncbi:hypothetical protein WN944_014139 [Citrus x changshan-huyou]|uniref:Uncharacterized protein n=1 Tax=Citrus x changshan-huyou TaxID=2935761 RepID=A0AAP0QPS7_9ROSI